MSKFDCSRTIHERWIHHCEYPMRVTCDLMREAGFTIGLQRYVAPRCARTQSPLERLLKRFLMVTRLDQRRLLCPGYLVEGFKSEHRAYRSIPRSPSRPIPVALYPGSTGIDDLPPADAGFRVAVPPALVSSIPRGRRGQMGFDIPPQPTPDFVQVRPTAVRRFPEYVPLPVRKGPGGAHRGIPQDPLLPGDLLEGKHLAVGAEVPASPRPPRRDDGLLPGRTTRGLVLEDRLPISARGSFLRPRALG